MEVYKIIASFIFVMSLMFIILFFVKKYMPNIINASINNSSPIKNITSMRIDQKRTVHVIQYKNREHVFLLSPEGHIHLSDEKINNEITFKERVYKS